MNRKGLLIVDHGSTKEEANKSLEDIEKLVQQLIPTIVVKHAHMELADPTIKDGIDALVAENVTEIHVFPYMLAPGRHATKDIPNIISNLKTTYPTCTFTVTSPLGVHQKLAEIIIERSFGS
jgi:sirohydrochlorin ferrochelatase